MAGPYEGEEGMTCEMGHSQLQDVDMHPGFSWCPEALSSVMSQVGPPQPVKEESVVMVVWGVGGEKRGTGHGGVRPPCKGD